MNYLFWALLGLAAYTLVAPLMKVATGTIPSDVAVLVTNVILVVASAAIVATADESLAGYLTDPRAPYMYAAGVCLTVGIIAYYRALSLGPVSVVTPVFGMFIVTSSAIGIAFLDESLTGRKIVGIGLAIMAVYLTSIE